MATENLIAATDFCTYHHIEYAFIGSLEDAGLVELVMLNEEKFIEMNQLPQLERIIRLSQDLDINIAGIDVIIYLLKRMEHMQEEISALRNKIGVYPHNTF